MPDGKKLRTKTILFVNFFLFQGFVLAVAVTIAWFDIHHMMQIPEYYLGTVALIAGAAVSVGSVFILKEIVRLGQREYDAERDALHLEESRQLIDVLRAHRHDFLNHIQVIYGLAQMGKLERMADYISDLTDNMRSDCELSQLAIPELAAFLLKKSSSALHRGIKLEVDVLSNLAGLDIPSTDLISVIGNILDNAFYAAEESEERDKQVLLCFSENHNNCCVLVANNGNPIPDELKEMIFEKGFSTKGEKGTGLGLFITRKLVAKHGGSIQLMDRGKWNTCFQIELPKHRQT